MLIKANLVGIDLNKKEKHKIPEATGVLTSCIFLVVMFLFIPIAFGNQLIERGNFSHVEFVEFMAALLSICCMILLGFADDILDLKWRYKLLLPTLASLPLLIVYHVNFNSTTVITPNFMRFLVGNYIDLGLMYYVYMGMLAVFCTNAINIYAGVNGLEVGQSVTIAASIATFNIIELSREWNYSHLFSLYFMVPYLATSLPLLRYNWYPAKVFVGDTFCYFSGMTIAVVAILGHFSKTVVLFFLPQIANFLLSLPQILRLLPCPRHRLPRLNVETDLLEPSTFALEEHQRSGLGVLCLRLYELVGVVSIEKSDDKERGVWKCTNCTVINLVLKLCGPMNEGKLTALLLALQVASSFLAFTIRYPLASYFYDV